MSTGRSAIRTTVPVVATLAALLLVPSTATADPPALNRDPCAQLLARAAIWPGGLEDDSGTVRLVSDAYVSYVSSQPDCTSASGS